MPTKRKTKKQKVRSITRRIIQKSASENKSIYKPYQEKDILVIPAHFIKADIVRTILVSLVCTAIIAVIYYYSPDGNITKLISK